MAFVVCHCIFAVKIRQMLNNNLYSFMEIKIRYVAAALFAAMSVTVFAGPANRTKSGLEFEAQGLKVRVEFYSPEIVRVYKEPATKPFSKVSIPVIMKPGTVSLSYGGSGATSTVGSDKVKVCVNTETGGIVFTDSKGNIMLRDKDYGTQFTPRNDAGRPSFTVRQAFLLDTAEVIYGLGQQQTGLVSQRNQRLLLRNENMKICIPFVHSAKGYGLYWDNYSPTVFLDNPQEMSFDSEVGDCADYYFIYGGNADGVIAGVRQLTGQAPMYPLWTLGFWQSRERYKSPDELCGVVDKYRELKVPLDGIIQDWQYWGCDSNWNAMKFQNPRYINKLGDPEYMRYLPTGENPKALQTEPRIKSPKEMIDYVHKQNAHIMISVWASFGPWTEMYHKMDSLGALYDFETWPRKAGVKPYDPFNPVARDLYWSEMKRNIFDLGMDAWWLDSTEPDHFDVKDRDFDVKTYLGSFRSVHNAFPLVTNKGVYEHQRATTSAKRVFLLTRSSFLGQQHYASHSWSGDVTSTWDNMRRQITAGLNYSLCGIPYWGTDLGGFFASRYNNNVKNVAYQELHVRWYEWGAFQPIMRSHNSSPVAVEIYQFGKKGDWAYDAIEKFTHLRYRLLPYLYSTTWEVTSRSGSIIRPLVMDFASDKKVLNLGSEYMFGRSFLVRPVTDSLYTWQDRKRNGHMKDLGKVASVDVYLPVGAGWIDFWTGQRHNGGQTIMRQVPIDIMPVYVREGSIVPFGPAVQYATEKRWDNLEIRIYPGADASFTLYEDENDNYNYEKGAYTTIDFKWDDSSHTLTIGARNGKFKGMLKSRKFNIVLVDGSTPAGDVAAEGRSVKYSGRQVEVKL